MATFLQDLSPTSTGILAFLSLYIIYQIVQRSITFRRHNAIIRKNGCKPIATYHHREPILGLDIFLENSKLSKTGGLWDRVRERYLALNSWTFSILLLGTKVINTAEPENIKAILANQFREFELPPRRKEVRISNPSFSNLSSYWAKLSWCNRLESLLGFLCLTHLFSGRNILTQYEDVPTRLWAWHLHHRW